MGLVTGTVLTIYIVYIYAMATRRLLSVYRQFKQEHRVFSFVLVFSRSSPIQCIH